MIKNKHKKFLPNSLKIILAALIIIYGLFVMFRFDPAESEIFPPCPFRKLTGLYCPGCGSLRAVHQILHGNFATAFRLNPLMIIFVCTMALLSIGSRLKGGHTEYLKRLSSGPATGWAVFVVIVAYWLCRNVPVFPFNLLAPG